MTPKLPSTGIIGAEVTGITKLDGRTEAYRIKWYGAPIGALIEGRKGWRGHRHWQGMTLSGQLVGKPERSITKATKALVEHTLRRPL